MIYLHATIDALREAFFVWLFLATLVIAIVTLHPSYRNQYGVNTILFGGISLFALGHCKGINYIASEKLHLGIVPADITGYVEIVSAGAVVLWVVMAAIRRFT